MYVCTVCVQCPGGQNRAKALDSLEPELEAIVCWCWEPVISSPVLTFCPIPSIPMFPLI